MPSRCSGMLGVLRIAVFAAAATMSSACDDSSQKNANADAAPEVSAAFEARISGGYHATVTGTGVLKFLADAGFDKRGYFFLADGRGVRLHRITFVIPRGTGTGRHDLKSLPPLEIGTVPSVRVDRITGSTVTAADKKTSGYLELTAFPNDAAKLSAAAVAGQFEFETENPTGERIKVTGRFSFTAD